jgi:hypothetical protein
MPIADIDGRCPSLIYDALSGLCLCFCGSFGVIFIFCGRLRQIDPLFFKLKGQGFEVWLEMPKKDLPKAVKKRIFVLKFSKRCNKICINLYFIMLNLSQVFDG